MTGIYGLVVCGGQSTRMGTDKSLLDYHGRPQRYYLYGQLQAFCEQVFLSCNAQQAGEVPTDYPVITDAPAWHDIGPMAALLSAFDRYPDKTFMVLACDYPFFTITEMQQLAEAARQDMDAAAFYHEDSGIYEPLLAIYGPAAGKLIKAAFEQRQYSLQRLLKSMQAVQLFPAESRAIQSVDTPDDYGQAVRETKQIK